jgi:ABC-type Zn uptake system ZnuABC Zn-binding protein ZnuA
MKKIIVLISMIFVLFSCTNKLEETNIVENEANKIKIMTSIVPLASIVNYIGLDFVEAESVVPA